MSVSNGQPGDSNTLNNAFASKTADNSMVGKQELANTDPVSGATIANTQRQHNSVASFVGAAVNGIYNLLPNWVSNAVGAPTDSLKERAEALTTFSANLDANKQDISEKGVANGYASLDGTGRVPSSQLTLEAFVYLGTWDAALNSPTLADGVGTTGDVYRVSVAGTQDLGSGNITFAVGDKVVYNGTTWEKWDTDDSDSANRNLSNLLAPTAINQELTFSIPGILSTADDTATDSLTINSGDASSGFSGLVAITSGSGTTSGNINLTTGNSSAGGTGAINLVTGAPTGGVRGSILLDARSVLFSSFIGTNFIPQFGTLEIGSATDKWLNVHGAKVSASTGGDEKIQLDSSTQNTPSANSIRGAIVRPNDGFNDAALFTANDATANSVATGSLFIESGNKTAGTGNSGNIQLYTGTSAGGTRGTINLLDGSTAGASVGYVWTLDNTTTGAGSWQAAGGGGGANTTLSNLTAPVAINQQLRFSGTNSITLPFGQAISGRDFGDTTDINLVGMNGSQELVLYGRVNPDANGARDLGTGSFRFRRGYFSAAVRIGTANGIGAQLLDSQSSPSGTGDCFSFQNEEPAKNIMVKTISEATNTGGLLLETGDSSGANSGNISIYCGTAPSGTRGNINMTAGVINHNQTVSSNVVWESGVSGSRPVSPVTGQRYFDTTIGKPIWYDGTNWVDGVGTIS